MTSLPSAQQAVREYKRRFGCEELFSDLKARGFNIEKTQLRHPQRFDRLLIVVALITFWLAGVARRLFVTRRVDNLVQPSYRHRYSFFQIAYRWLEQQILHERSSIPDPKYVFGLLVGNGQVFSPLRRLPMEVDTDSWLIHYHRRSFRRKVKANGEVLVDRDHYYIGQKYQGQRVLVILDAHEKHLEFYVQSQLVKTKPIRKQLYGVLPLDEFVDTMLKEAESETQRLARKRKLTRRTHKPHSN